ncbi:MAG: hypothetical protein FWE22_04635 [Firmicutes bacterium]|nr:hypothetical protein [Bacillota bacterium]
MDNKKSKNNQAMTESERRFNELSPEIKEGLSQFQDEYKKREELMKPMSEKLVQEEIDKINFYLSQRTWMEFQFGHIGRDKIVLFGCVDTLLPENDIEIVFEYPQTIASVFYWNMNEKKPFIKLSSHKELEKSTGLYAYEGCHVFSLNDEDMSNDNRFYIAAAGIKYNIIKPLQINLLMT